MQRGELSESRAIRPNTPKTEEQAPQKAGTEGHGGLEQEPTKWLENRQVLFATPAAAPDSSALCLADRTEFDSHHVVTWKHQPRWRGVELRAANGNSVKICSVN